MTRTLFTIAALTLLTLAAAPVRAQVRSGDFSADRLPFPTVALSGSGVSIDDPQGDLTFFDVQATGSRPAFLADLVRVDMLPASDGWIVTFHTANVLPANPDGPVNFVAFADRRGLPAAVTGSFQAGSNLSVLLLYGTKSGWHAEAHAYDPPTQTWRKEAIDIPFTISQDAFSLRIPFALLPREGNADIRFFTLTGNNEGALAVDIAPGQQLPPPRPSPRAVPSLLFLAVTWGIGFGSFAILLTGVWLQRRSRG